MANLLIHGYFNSQPHEEADVEPLCFTTWRIRHFNSQPHEEADTAMTGIHSGSTYFNSQPHEEADKFEVLSMKTFKRPLLSTKINPTVPGPSTAGSTIQSPIPGTSLAHLI